MRTSLLLPVAAIALAAAASPAQRTLAPGQTTGGSLSSGDRVMNGSHYDEYTFHARRGETVEVRMGSEDLDTYLYLYHDQGRLREVARDDDGGQGTDSRLRYTVREDGTYLVRASSAHRDTGPYMIALEAGGRDGGRHDGWDHDRRGDRGRLRADRPVHDYLSTADPQLDNGARYHLYRYAGRRGERVSIQLSSHAFDAYLVLGLAGGRHGIGQVLERDDDGAGDLDAHIGFTLPHDGEYVIRVNPVAGGTGRYTLELRSSRRHRGRDDDRDRGDRYDEDHLDGRLFGRWDLFDSRGGIRDRGSVGTLSVRETGEYTWRGRDGRSRRGRLVPFTPRDGARSGRYFLLENGPEPAYVYFTRDRGAGYITLVRRSTGREIARGYRDFTRSESRADDDTPELRLEP